MMFPRKRSCLKRELRATAEDGAQGWGQVAPYFADIAAQVVHRQVASYALGVNRFDIDAMMDVVRDRAHKFPGSCRRRAMGGVDTALWDMRGRIDEIVPLMRKEVDDDVALLVDANSCHSPPRAIEVGRMLQDNGISHYEGPCPYWEFDQTREVTEALEIDVTGGEQDCMMERWQSMISGRDPEYGKIPRIFD